MAGLAAGTTRSRMTQLVTSPHPLPHRERLHSVTSSVMAGRSGKNIKRARKAALQTRNEWVKLRVLPFQWRRRRDLDAADCGVAQKARHVRVRGTFQRERN